MLQRGLAGLHASLQHMCSAVCTPHLLQRVPVVTVQQLAACYTRTRLLLLPALLITLGLLCSARGSGSGRLL